MLMHCTAKSWVDISAHVLFSANQKSSCFIDDVLNAQDIWPNSVPPAGTFPSEAQEIARRAGAPAALKMIPPGLKVGPLDYHSPLTCTEHEALVTKMVTMFEDTVQSSPDLTQVQWAAIRPDSSARVKCRLVVTHWLRTVRACAEADLSAEDLKAVEAAVTQGDALDAQMIQALTAWPISWHMALTPDLKAELPEEVELDQEKLFDDAMMKTWNAKLGELLVAWFQDEGPYD